MGSFSARQLVGPGLRNLPSQATLSHGHCDRQGFRDFVTANLIGSPKCCAGAVVASRRVAEMHLESACWPGLVQALS